MRRLYRAPDRSMVVPPGHDFQTAISLRNRDDVTGTIRGTPPWRRIAISITPQGLARIKALVEVPAPPPAVDPSWPFPCKSRPLPEYRP